MTDESYPKKLVLPNVDAAGWKVSFASPDQLKIWQYLRKCERTLMKKSTYLAPASSMS
jgi:hypothetical protein